MSVIDDLPENDPLRVLYNHCVDCGVDMKVNHPEAFAEHMLDYAMELMPLELTK